MKIAVVGVGYVGLVVGTGLAENGHFVTCVDRDEERIQALRAGQLPIYEPGLEELMKRNIEEERLGFTTDFDTAVENSLLVFICVGTPSLEDGHADVSEVMACAEQVAQAMRGYHIIVLKSTCPVGMADKVRERVASLTSQPFDVVVNPEFLKEGAAVDDFMRPDRVLIGCEDVRVQEIMKELYAPFMRTGKPILCMGVRSAEMTKYAVNVTLAARISLINELANICEAYGADIGEVREGLMADSRIGSTYLFPGLGFGGSCLPKDVVACATFARDKGIPCDMLDAVSAVNDRQVQMFIDRIFRHYGGSVTGRRFAIWGLSFKPRTDDIRHAPALRVLDALLEGGASAAVYDPVANRKVAAIYGDRILVGAKSYAVLEGADGLVIATEWREFHNPDFARIASLMREKVIFDGRNLYNPKVLAGHGFRYYSIGRA
ncbi:MAG TPA: UDP-glucose/GDP-mannose dehydrogenase family protein [Candidatus Hydrogenedentes bacterium]|nr:UDP-glucose/GDP-mannose dehydrogenase family protein [Candidatus Hydrogenedentota bacterium]HOV73206.1 UDP-glucose/GDP-mannose dehydrogenase family protein [Candidatus Hydrogenedentota bacterium]HPC17432.1 UDP-glucose/GDP-mannose dehydrogenase family protein [Candidatus Hydrogenedentota bacterium]HRT20024.1 UDP-glucose/GDP-mannose dehydrogenase family protein [Candidatus Hydrogenedentota bacterium]HRT64912.1 UDP-glucose/GDP-mannose dehydrogenase family protein [Candidatus Hydrogenedentota ba